MRKDLFNLLAVSFLLVSVAGCGTTTSSTKATLDKDSYALEDSTRGPGDGHRPMPRPEELFSKADKDGDGTVTHEEFKAGLADLPSPPEMKQPDADEMATRFFSRFDTDKDDKVTLEEMKQAAPPRD